MKPNLASNENLQKFLATRLQKQKQRVVYQKNIPFVLQKKEIKEQIKFYKKELLKACQNKNKAEAQKFVGKLIELRAKQIPIFLQEQTGIINPDAKQQLLEKQVSRYYQDCHKLIQSAEALLTI